MTDSVRLGRILGIPVGLHWGALLVAALFTTSLATSALAQFAPDTGLRIRIVVGIAGVVVFFASILAHELGHAVTALHHGVGVSGITLWLMGGVAKLDRPAPTARSEFQIAIAGPAVSLGLGVFFASVGVIVDAITPNRLALAVLVWLAGVNIVLAVFNLLPAAPLDGGRVLTALLWRRWGDAEKARLAAGRAGLVLGGLLAALGLYLAVDTYGPTGLFNVAVGAMVFFAASAEIRGAVLTRRLRTTTVDLLHTAHPRPVPDTMSVGDLDALAGEDGRTTAYPVVRWDHEPIGFVVPESLDHVAGPERSWTTVGQVMHHRDDVMAVASDDAIGPVLDKWASAPVPLAVTVDERGELVGTLTDHQVRPIVVAPTLWGSDREPLPTPPRARPVTPERRRRAVEDLGPVPTEPPRLESFGD